MRLADELRRVGALELVLVAATARRTGRTASSPSRTRRRSPRAPAARSPPHVGAGDRDLVHVRPVRVELGQVAPGQLATARPASRRRSGAPCAHSHSGSGVPQYLVRDSAQSTLFRSHSPYRPCLMRRRLPVGPLVLGQQLVLDRGGADEPGRQRVVEQRRVAPPAVRVAVLVPLGPEQQRRARPGRGSAAGRRP